MSNRLLSLGIAGRLGLLAPVVMASQVLVPSAALAQEDEEDESADEAEESAEETEPEDDKAKERADQPADDSENLSWVVRPVNPLDLLMIKGKMAISGVLRVNLSAETAMGDSRIADPVTLGPDLWYGLGNKLSLGLVHSEMGRSGFWTTAHSICVVGDTCGRPYKQLAVLARWGILDGSAPLILDAGLDVFSLWNPTAIRVKVGVRGQLQFGKIFIDYAPSVFITAVEDLAEGSFFDGDLIPHELTVPVSVGYLLSESLVAGVQTGIAGDLSTFDESYAIPLAAGAMYRVNPKLWIGGTFMFHNLAGQGGSADERSLHLVGAYAL